MKDDTDLKEQPTFPDWQIVEELVAGVFMLIPAVVWWNGHIAFETVVVAYLAIITFIVGQTANRLLKRE